MILATKSYDPAAPVSKATNALLAMTAFDTTNLRHTFVVPSNGAVLVRLHMIHHGTATWAAVLLGVMESTTVKARVSPWGGPRTASMLATTHGPIETSIVIPGLTPGASLTWDAAYGVEQNVASANIKYGGANDTTADNAFGAFLYDIYTADNLLGAVLYDPASAVSVSMASRVAMTAFDTSNLRITFTATTSRALVRIVTALYGANTYAGILLGVMEGAAVKGRASGLGSVVGQAALSIPATQEVSFIVPGLTPGQQYTWDAAYGIEILNAASSAIKYGGPNNNTPATDAFGAFQYEIWAA